MSTYLISGSPVELCELVKCRYHHTSLVNKRVKVSMIGTHDNTILIDLYLRKGRNALGFAKFESWSNHKYVVKIY